MKENPPSSPGQPEPPSGEKRGPLTSLVVGFVGVISTIYLLNPGAGFIELIPDNIPIIGNLDEAAATAVLISCLAYFGIDLGRLFGRGRAAEERDRERDREREKAKTTLDAEYTEP